MPNMKCHLVTQASTHHCNNQTPAIAERNQIVHSKENASNQNVIYQATVTTATRTETYVGLATNFKKHYKNHQSSVRRLNTRNEMKLSKYIWTLQDSKKCFQIKCKVLKKCKPYSNISKKCNLSSLNRQNKLGSSCPHRNRYVLQNSRVTQLKHNPSVT